jgi:hypothetical protein
LALNAVVERTADYRQVAFLKWQQPILYVTYAMAGTEIENLKVAVTIHPYTLAVMRGHKQDVDRTRFIERPNVHAFGVDLGLDQAEGIL